MAVFFKLAITYNPVRIFDMKSNHLSILTALLLLTAGSGVLANEISSTVVGAGARYHANHSVFTDLPYDDGDISVAVYYEGHQVDTFWQFGVEYAFDLGGSETVNYVITPEFNLLWKDGIWFGGIGILYPYIDDEVSGGDWLDLYWQGILGAKIPIGILNIDLGVHYPFEKWSVVDEIDVKDLDYTAGLSVEF